MSGITKHPLSPNFSTAEIAVEFVVLHYTACSLARTLDIFYDPARKVCAHFVIDEAGQIHDLGGFWDGTVLQGAHAGQSRFAVNGRSWEKLNTCSIGVEIVNLNGNVIPYSEAQYEAITSLLRHLKSRFPALQDPNRVVGHEQIAGFRGKADPGHCFEWSRVFLGVYGPALRFPERPPLLSEDVLAGLRRFVASCSEAEKSKPEFWSRLSERLESGEKF